MADAIRIGFVGVGQIAQSHLRNYQKVSGAKVVAATDVNAAALDKVAAEFNIPSKYTDFHEMLKRDDIDAVDVCLHNNLHAPVTIAALNAGKHVYCEKPMAGSYIDAETMLKTARKRKKNLHIQLSTLYSKESRVAKTLIDNGRLGNIYHARSTGHRRRGRPFVDGYGTASFVQKEVAAGGALYDMGVYHIAQLLYLMGNPKIERVSGKTYQETALDPARAKRSGYNVEELGLGFVRFAGGLTLDIIEAWAVHMNAFEGSSIFGSQGGVRLAPFGFFTTVEDLATDSTVDMDGALYRWANVKEVGDVYDSSQHHWIAALQNRVELLPTAEIALNTMLISEAIYMSEKLGREVTAAEVKKGSVSTAKKL
ncbi:MAG: oxidoreductase [Lentisphaerae bacterium RIFOXYB12_FULL_65_16]|nr:MAG: oxidoreductase [Lentisphaerae bacterium RIFOXYA12_64_32]OGV84297.1 MAG: oxidoreductase [Lentisphaerae bacterium RIFOXYB12_FULL_65_16]